MSDEAHEELASLHAALADLDDVRAEAEAVIAAAKERLRAARERAHHALRDYGAARVRDEQPAAPGLIRALYWRHPLIRVDDIVKAFGLRSATDAMRLAGPGRFTEPCLGDCGTTVIYTRPSRTSSVPDKRRWKGNPRYCPACRQQIVEEEAERWRKQEREWREEQAILQRAIDDGLAKYDTTTEISYQGIRRFIETKPADGDR